MSASTVRDGRSIAYEISGDPSLVFVHANGFCKEIWHPVIAELGDPGHVSIDQPGHGLSEAPDPPFDWWDFGRNALAVIDAVGMERPTGVGHSSGAATLAMAEILRPGTFDRLVLIEPIVFPPPYRRVDHQPLIAATLRRRTTFESTAAAAGAYRGRGPFEQWDERALDAYTTHGFRQSDRGWILRCSPETEAEVYATSEEHGAWDRLGEIGCPVDLVVGEHSDTHHEVLARSQADQFREVRLTTIAGASHFVPMEAPATVASIIRSG